MFWFIMFCNWKGNLVEWVLNCIVYLPVNLKYWKILRTVNQVWYIYIICIIHPMMVNLNIEVNIIPAFQVQTNEQKEKVRAVRDERKKFKEIPEDLRKKHREHKENFERAREPLLQGLASKSDLKLFKEAQAKACEVLVRANSMTFYYGVIKFM